MLEKLAIRRQLKKVSNSFGVAKQELARLDKHFTVNPYTKGFYILDCVMLSKTIKNLLTMEKQLLELVDKIKKCYTGKEQDEKLDIIKKDMDFLQKAVKHCKNELIKKQEIFEPDKIVVKYRQKIRYDGKIDTVPVEHVERTPKSPQFDEMFDQTFKFNEFYNSVVKLGILDYIFLGPDD